MGLGVGSQATLKGKEGQWGSTKQGTHHDGRAPTKVDGDLLDHFAAVLEPLLFCRAHFVTRFRVSPRTSSLSKRAFAMTSAAMMRHAMRDETTTRHHSLFAFSPERVLGLKRVAEVGVALFCHPISDPVVFSNRHPP